MPKTPFLSVPRQEIESACRQHAGADPAIVTRLLQDKLFRGVTLLQIGFVDRGLANGLILYGSGKSRMKRCAAKVGFYGNLRVHSLLSRAEKHFPIVKKTNADAGDRGAAYTALSNRVRQPQQLK